MSNAGNPDVLATPTQRGPVERQGHAIERLTSCWQLIIRDRDHGRSAEDILDLVESLQDDLEAVGAPDLPSEAREKREQLLRRADEFKGKDIWDNWDATSTTAVSTGATRNWTAREIEDEVIRRLYTEQTWRYRPLARDPRSTPRRLMHSLWGYYHEAWDLGNISETAEKHYLSLWRANEPFRDGVDPQQSPFAEILRNPNSTEDNVVWRKVRDIKGGAQGKVSLWEMRRQNGQNLGVILKDTSENEFFMDYCSEAFLTLRLNAIGCPNVIKVLDWNYYDDAGKRRFQICYEWAKYGDLDDLVGWYYDNNLILPEAFIWHVFNSLAKALVYCRYGTESETRVDKWEELVCGDLKEANILVCEPDDEHNIYPCLKLADFGLAYPIPSMDVRDFKQATPWGTPGYQAPEIITGRELDDKQRDRHSVERRQRAERGLPGRPRTFDVPNPRARLGSHSDVWALGATISNLMSLVNRHLRADDVRKLLRHRLRRCYYSKVLIGLVERCLDDDYNHRLAAYELYNVTRYYAGQHKDRVYHAAAHFTNTGEPSYWQEVLLGRRQEEFEQDGQFHEQYTEMNLFHPYALQDSLRGHNENHLHPNEVIAAPTHLNVSSIIDAGKFMKPPPAHFFEDPFRFGYKPLVSGANPVGADPDDTDSEFYPGGGGPPAPPPPHDGVPPAEQPVQQAAVDDEAPRIQGNVSRVRRPYGALLAQQPAQQAAVDDQALRTAENVSRTRRPDDAPTAQQPPQQVALDDQAPRTLDNVPRTRRPYSAPVRSPYAFAAFEQATLQRSPGSGERPVGRRLRMVTDEQASMVSNVAQANNRAQQALAADQSLNEQPGTIGIRSDLLLDRPPANSQTHQLPPANDVVTSDHADPAQSPTSAAGNAASPASSKAPSPPIEKQPSKAPQAPQTSSNEQVTAAAQTELITHSLSNQPPQYPLANEAPMPDPFDSAPPPPRNDASAPSPPPAQAATSDAPQPQPNDHPHRTPTANEAELPHPFTSAPPPPQKNNPAPPPPPTQPAPPPRAPDPTSSRPAALTQQATPPANAPPPSQRSSTSSALSVVPPGPIRPPSPHPRAQPSPLSSPLTPVPPGPITRPFSALEERHLFGRAPRPEVQRRGGAGKKGSRRERRRVVQEAEGEEGKVEKVEKQKGEREERARKRRRG